MNRRAALELSMQSIAIFILAIIVLGLIIGVIYGIFERIPPVDMPEEFDNLGVNPTFEESFVVQNRQVTLPRRGTEIVRFAVFNTLDDTQSAGSRWYFDANDCVGFNDKTIELDVQSPRYVLTRDLEYGDVIKFRTIMQVEPGSTVTRGEQYTCFGFVSTQHTGDDRTADQDNAFAYGTFILTIE